MKQLLLAFIFVSILALGQDKPRVFVQGKGSQNLTASGSGGGGSHWGSWGARASADSHDESMEVTKDLQKDCSGVIVTLSQANADYTVMLNRESKHNRGLLRTNSQVQVANRLGDILGTNATRTVGNASKDACQLIIADWSQHGKIIVQDPPVPTPAPAEAPDKAKAEAVSAAESQPAATSPVVGPDSQGQNSTPASGRLQIDSIPSGADIEVDGSFVGNTPSDLQLAQGDHVIVIKKSGFKNWERKLKSSGGSNVHIGAELEKADAT